MKRIPRICRICRIIPARATAPAALLAIAACGGVPVPPPPAPTPPNPTMQAVQSMRLISNAVNVYCNEFNAMPTDLDTVRSMGYLSKSDLESPLSTSEDGTSDYWLSATHTDCLSSTLPGREIMIYDHASYEFGREVIVYFFDGSIRAVPRDEFLAMLEDEINAAIEVDSP